MSLLSKEMSDKLASSQVDKANRMIARAYPNFDKTQREAMKETLKDIGNSIRNARLSNNISMFALAKIWGLSSSELSTIESVFSIKSPTAGKDG